jgi:hypothetical protein
MDGEDRSPPPSAPPSSAAERMYPHLSDGAGGELGGTGYDVARKLIDSGIAQPDPRFEQANQRAADGPAWDSTKYEPPSGYTVHEPSMREFSSLANEFGLSHKNAERALDFYRRVSEGEDKARHGRLEQAWNEWHAATQRELGHQLEPMVDDIKAAVGSDRDAQRFYELLSWSGLQHDPSVLRVLHRLSNGGRRW